ncbi:MAG TPA: geranylgeranyl reductase family protein [bacterium]|nr:geranylgeranyl reductase family protein [bacterium]HOL47833.1 geranylgeranyl reductase family protein [bacterium]HPQ19546.1 geranylgeranyl reductase family protein [bacterium]
MIYDVIIIGCGPAGTNAGFYLSKAGLNVLAIEKAQFPRLKVCAGGLPYHITEYNFEIENIIQRKCDKTIFTYKGKDKVEIKFNNFTIDMVMRKDFDNYLLQRAKKVGLKICENEQFKKGIFNNELIEIETDKNYYKTKYLIGADGALSSVNKEFRIIKNKIFGITLNSEIEVKEEFLTKINNCIYVDIGNIKNGYFWIFPKKEHLSVGLGSTNYKYKNLKKLFYKILKYFNLTENNIKKINDLKGWILPFFTINNNIEKYNSGNVLLVGDAANLVDSLSGEGIYYALKSGELAAISILQTEKKENNIDNYNNLLKDKIINNLIYSEKFANLFYKFPYISYKLGVKNKEVCSLFCEMLIGKIFYNELYEKLKEKYGIKFNLLKMKL